jgi:hypothetical protein
VLTIVKHSDAGLCSFIMEFRQKVELPYEQLLVPVRPTETLLVNTMPCGIGLRKVKYLDSYNGSYKDSYGFEN